MSERLKEMVKEIEGEEEEEKEAGVGVSCL